MIQLKYSSSADFQTSAVYSDNRVSSSVESAVFELTSSFSGKSNDITGSITSNKTGYVGGWLLLATSQSSTPTASGFYDANIYEGLLPDPDIYSGSWLQTTASWAEAVFEWDGNIGQEYWRNNPDIWNTVQETWAGIGAQILRKGQLITQERIFVSGSDYDDEYKYENQELALYNVYDG